MCFPCLTASVCGSRDCVPGGVWGKAPWFYCSGSCSWIRILFLVPDLVSGSGSGSWFWIRFQVPLYCSTNVSQVSEIEICFGVKLAKLRYIF